jgi:UDP-glucose 6-dehydrogenase
MVEVETPEKIHFAIEKKLALGASYIDALIEYSKEKDIEIETIAEIVKKSPVIKEKLRSEAQSMRLLKVKNATPSFFE